MHSQSISTGFRPTPEQAQPFYKPFVGETCRGELLWGDLYHLG